MARVRIKVRDFYTNLGMGIPSFPLILLLIGECDRFFSLLYIYDISACIPKG